MLPQTRVRLRRMLYWTLITAAGVLLLTGAPGCAGPNRSEALLDVLGHLEPDLVIDARGCPRLVWREEVAVFDTGLRAGLEGWIEKPGLPGCPAPAKEVAP